MIRSLSRQALPFVAAAFVACAVVQVFLAGLGVFDDPRAFITHRGFGSLFGWLTLVILVLALLGRTPRRITGLCALLLLLFTVQSVLPELRADLPKIAALHPVNGFAILFVGITITRSAWAVRREAALEVAAAETVATAASLTASRDLG
jgi:hypothetical protein